MSFGEFRKEKEREGEGEGEGEEKEGEKERGSGRERERENGSQYFHSYVCEQSCADERNQSVEVAGVRVLYREGEEGGGEGGGIGAWVFLV